MSPALRHLSSRQSDRHSEVHPKCPDRDSRSSIVNNKKPRQLRGTKPAAKPAPPEEAYKGSAMRRMVMRGMMGMMGKGKGSGMSMMSMMSYKGVSDGELCSGLCCTSAEALSYR